ncbi:MAG: hybrid sensor histidine kinase/response regulator [Smithellaceae bacterium]
MIRKPAYEELEQRISEREEELIKGKREKEALRDRAETLANILNGVSMLITFMDCEERYVFVNRAYAEWYGLNQQDVIGKRAADILKPDAYKRASHNIKKVLNGQQVSYENMVIDKDGRERHVRVNYEPCYRGEEVKGFYSSIVDITENKRVEEALRESESHMKSISDNLPDGMIYQIIAKADGARQFTYLSDSVRKLHGISPDEGIADSSLIYNRIHEDDIASLMKAEDEALKTLSTFRMEVRVREPSGGIRWSAFSSTPSLTKEGSTRWNGIELVITERKLAEEYRESMQERLKRAEKMEVLGRMAGKVAHDLNNVLGAMTGYSELLLMELPEGQRARTNAEKIMQSTQRAAAIIQDLLTLARRGVISSEVTNLNVVISGFLKSPVFERMKEHHPRVTFRTDCEKKLLNIKVSPVHLEKMLMNLLSNAADAIPDMGVVSIRTENRYLDRGVNGYDKVKEGDYVVLTVSDTGTGIPAENLNKIFEPFYTNKSMGRSGTGLGLSIVWGTVKDHDGHIDVQSKAGEGTTFTLYFPVTREGIILPQQKIPKEQYLGRGESVLVVDDIAEQRDVASGLLTQLGYKVHVASRGEEAVEYLKENQADILVLDMIMAPGIDGLETYRKILEINPKQKAILVSGFSETDRVREAQRLGAGAYVKKPYVMETIGMAIQDELNR